MSSRDCWASRLFRPASQVQDTRMSAVRSINLTRVDEWKDGRVHSFQDCLVSEEPLEIRVNGEPFTVTMRTPGHDLELAAGLLFTEGVIQSGCEITSVLPVSGKNTITVGVENAAVIYEFKRILAATPSCGVCGKTSIESIRRRGIARPATNLVLAAETLCSLPEKLKSNQPVFGKTGGLHAAALFDNDGQLIVLREDIGRHNAVDKVIGWAMQQKKIPLSDYAMMVSGRGGFEIVQKVLAAGVPVLASVSAPSGLAVQLAREFGMTLVGFLRGRRFVIYSAPSRITG
jgi:FdhD protein